MKLKEKLLAIKKAKEEKQKLLLKLDTLKKQKEEKTKSADGVENDETASEVLENLLEENKLMKETLEKVDSEIRSSEPKPISEDRENEIKKWVKEINGV